MRRLSPVGLFVAMAQLSGPLTAHLFARVRSGTALTAAWARSGAWSTPAFSTWRAASSLALGSAGMGFVSPVARSGWSLGRLPSLRAVAAKVASASGFWSAAEGVDGFLGHSASP
jgi:hypothetical protein